MVFDINDITYDSYTKSGEISPVLIPLVISKLVNATNKGNLDWKEFYTHYKGVTKSGVEVILYKYTPVFVSIYLNEKVGGVKCSPENLDVLNPLVLAIDTQIAKKDARFKLVEELNRVFEKDF